MKNQFIRAALKSGNRHSLRISARISFGSQNYTYRRFFAPLNLDIRQSPLGYGKENLQQIALQSWKNNLCLGIAKAGVEFNGLRFAIR
ncbi:hypothetical protein D3C75_943150 [compost metagenome]